MKKVIITVIDNIEQDYQVVTSRTCTYSGPVYPVDLCSFIDDHVGERPKHEEKH